MQDAGARLPKNGEAAQASSGEAPAEGGLKGKAKAVLVAASVAAIVIGAYQIGGPFIFGGGDRQSDKNPVQPLSHSELQTEPPAAAPDRLTADALSPTPMLAPKQPAAAAAAPAPSTNTPSPQPAAEPDVTGSIPDAASSRAASPADRLPIEIGGTRLRSAAANGDGAAAYEIANRYAEGRGVIADVAEAARWYERAAAKGVALAQFRYASMLEKGVGVKKDLAQARRYYTAAAEQGNAKAMHNLAVLYAEGIEGKPDYANAVVVHQGRGARRRRQPVQSRGSGGARARHDKDVEQLLQMVLPRRHAGRQGSRPQARRDRRQARCEDFGRRAA